MATSTHPDDFDHSVTRPNTVKHWTLYTLDAWESKNPDERRDDEAGGASAEDLYEFAAGDDSWVFRSDYEVSSSLSELRRKPDIEPLARRTPATTFEGPDVIYYYRLTEYGRKVLLDLGVPEMLPNRQKDDYNRQLEGATPAHEPGWWLPDEPETEPETHALAEADPKTDAEEVTGAYEWTDPDEWVETDHDRVFYRSTADAGFERGEQKIARKLAEMFEGVMFVITMGPYRMHDMAYAIRDPFEKVVQLDIYSPMFMHRKQNEITASFEELVHDLMRGLANASEVSDDDA